MVDTIETLQSQLEALQQEAATNRRSFEQLRAEQLFSEKVLDSLPGIFYLYDEDGHLLRWNRNHEKLTGFTAKELPERGLLDWFDGDDKKRIHSEITALFETGVRRVVEADLIIKHGRKIPYYFTALRMVVDGKAYLLGMGVDLTQQKRTEEELRKSEEKYRAIFENAVEGIFQTTPEGGFVSANPAMASILGYESPEGLIRSIKDIPLLIEHFLKTEQKSGAFPTISGDMIETMLRYDWPGNVRELQNVLQRFVTLHQFDLMNEARAPRPRNATVAPPFPPDQDGLDYHARMDRFEKDLIEHTLQLNRWHREESANHLGLPVRTFYRKLKKHGLLRQK